MQAVNMPPLGGGSQGLGNDLNNRDEVHGSCVVSSYVCRLSSMNPVHVRATGTIVGTRFETCLDQACVFVCPNVLVDGTLAPGRTAVKELHTVKLV